MFWVASKNFSRAIDQIINSLETRFDQADLKPMLKISEALINSANNCFDADLTDELDNFKKILDLNCLRDELKEFTGICKVV